MGTTTAHKTENRITIQGEEAIFKYYLIAFPVVYQLDYTCNATHMGETKKRVLTRTINGTVSMESGKV